MRKVLFCYDGPLIKSGDKYYGRAINNSMLNRYIFFSNNVELLIRVRSLKETEKSNNYSSISSEYKVNECPNLSSVKGLIFYRKKAKKIIEQKVKESDFLIIRFPSLIGFYSAMYANKHKKPYLIELVSCPWDTLWYHSLKGKIMAPIYKYLTKKYVKSAPYVHYVSKKFLQKRYPTNGKSLACSDAILTPINRDILEKRLNNNFSKNKTITLCTIANVDIKYKGQRYVIKAMANLIKKGYRLNYLLIGGGNQDFLRKYAEKLNVDEYVIFEGPVKHEIVEKKLENIDIYIQPSDAESHGRVILEAMNQLCPCIGSSTGGIPELVDPKYVFKRKKVKDLESKIEKMINSDDKKTIYHSLNTAEKYQKNILDYNRNQFYDKIIKEI